MILNIAVCGSKNIWLVYCAENLFSKSASLKYVEFYYPILKRAQISFKLLVFKSDRVVLLKQKYKSIFIQAITFSADLNSCYKVKTLWDLLPEALLSVLVILENVLNHWDHLFSTYAKFSEKRTFVS